MDFNAALGEQPEIDPVALPAVKGMASIDAVRAALSLYDAPLAEMVESAAALEVKDGPSQITAVEMAGQVKKLDKAIEKARKSFVDPANEYVRAVNGLAKSYQGQFQEIERDLKNKITQYQFKAELERRKAEELARKAAAEVQKKLDAEAKAAHVEPVKVVAPVVPEPPKVVRTAEGSASQRKTWTFEVTTPAEVPREYLMVDERLIRDAVKNGVRTIPGVNIYEKTETVIRS